MSKKFNRFPTLIESRLLVLVQLGLQVTLHFANVESNVMDRVAALTLFVPINKSDKRSVANHFVLSKITLINLHFNISVQNS